MGLFDGIAKGVSNFFGGGDPLPYQTPQRIQNFMQPIPTTDMQATAHYQKILNDKQGYENSQYILDAWNKELANPDLTDEQRQKGTAAVRDMTTLRDSYAKDAEDVRKSAAAIGLDVSNYGSDKTLQETNQAYLTHRNLAVQNFLNNTPTLGELEENRYRELRSRGASPSMANSIVADERDKMNQQLANRLTDFMTTYGTNPDGSIDPQIGIAAMGRVLQNPQQVAQLFASGFAMPSKVFDAKQQLASHLALANANNAAAMDRTKWSGTNQLIMSREGNAAQDNRVAKTLEAQAHENELNRIHQEKMEAARLAVSLIKGNGKGNGSGSGNKLFDEIMALAQVKGFKDDLPEEEQNKILSESAVTVLEKKYGIGNKKLKDLFDLKEALTAAGVKDSDQRNILLKSLGWEEDKLTKDDEALIKAGNRFRSMFDDIQEAALGKDKGAAMAPLQEINEMLRSQEYRELLDKDAYNLAKRKVDMYTKLINGEYESDEGKTNYIKDRYLIEYGMEPSGDEIQRILKNEKFFGVPLKPKVTTPSWKFNVAPAYQGSVYNHQYTGAAYNNPNAPNSAYIPQGQAIWVPPNR